MARHRSRRNLMAASKMQYGFIGSGKMGTALIRGIVGAGLAQASEITASDVMPEVREKLSKDLGVRVTGSNAEVVERSNVVLLAVYPQTVRKVLPEIAPHVTDRHLLVSIAAGVTTQQIIEGLGAVR